MDVWIVATRDCGHCPALVRELDALGIAHRVIDVEAQPALVERLDIRHSPTLVIDGEVVFRHMPTPAELHAALGLRNAS